MKSLESLRNWLEPTKLYPEDLAQSFYDELKPTLRKMFRIVVLTIFVLTPLFIISEYFAYPPSTFHRLLFVHLLEFLLISVIIYITYYSPDTSLYPLLYLAITIELILVVLTCLIIADFVSLAITFFAITLMVVIVPWPNRWLVRFQLTLIAIFLGGYNLLVWQTSQHNPSWDSLALFLVGEAIFGIIIHALILHWRWDGFLSRHQVEQLNTHLKTLTVQLQNELSLAREIQRGLLPPPDPDWPNLDLACHSEPALQVGGDFYYYHKFNEKQFAVAVGDISGKGVSAALLMAATLSALAHNLSQPLRPHARLLLLDQAILPYTRPQRRNCALCYVEFNSHNRLDIINAGGIPPYIRRANGTLESLELGGFALGQGLEIQLEYQTMTLSLAPDDFVILVSDGVVEAKNSAGQFFGFERLATAIACAPTTNAKALLDYLLAEVINFVGHADPHDDLTIVVFKPTCFI